MTDSSFDIEQLLGRLEQAVLRTMRERQLKDPLMVGIHTGGAWVARELHRRLGLTEPLGLLDITFYRDDFSQVGIHPQVRRSQLPFSLEGRDIVLVDDVLFTGRTIRAALNELFDYGRPARVVLAVLIERDGRQIPVQADCIGAHVDLDPNQRIKLTGPEPLRLVVHTLEPPSEQRN